MDESNPAAWSDKSRGRPNHPFDSSIGNALRLPPRDVELPRVEAQIHRHFPETRFAKVRLPIDEARSKRPVERCSFEGTKANATRIGARIRLAFGALLLLASMGAHDARALDVLFPAYANPCCGGGPAMWAALISTAAAPARPFGLHVVFNPASGPGEAIDPNYVDANGHGPLPDLHAAGALVYGYVTTGYGTRAPAAVLADIDAYLVGHYAGRVDGIFFDEVSSDLAQVGTNQTYVARVEARRPGAPTIGNPGIPAIQNPSGQTTWTAADYAAVFDVLVTFEHTGAEYRSSYSPPVYLAEKPATGFAHLIHSEGPFDPVLLALAASRKAGLVFVSDDVMPNPYDLLPSYWTAFVAAITAFDAAAVPTASPFARVVLGLALLAVGTGTGYARRSALGRSALTSPSDRRRLR